MLTNYTESKLIVSPASVSPWGGHNYYKITFLHNYDSPPQVFNDNILNDFWQENVSILFD